jgi:transposase
MKQFLAPLRTSLINRLRAISVQAGLKKSALATAAGRKQQRAALTREAHILIAGSIERNWEPLEEELGAFKEKIDGIASKSELAPSLMSMPGAGPALAAAFLACVGD